MKFSPVNEWHAIITYTSPHYGTYRIDNVYFIISSYKCTNVVNLVWRLENEKDFCLIFPSFGPSNQWTWKVMTESGFHVYFWRLLIFKWILYKAGTFVFHQCNGVHFTEIALCGFLKDTLSSIKDTNTHYYFFVSLNFTI